MKSLFSRPRIMLLETQLIASGGESPKKTASRNTHNLQSIGPILLLILLAALIGEACTLTEVGMPPPPTEVIIEPTEEALQGPCAFGATGSTNSGWYWLRDSAYAASGQWVCRGLPTGRDLTISLATLVTNNANGGSGYSSPVKITTINPTSHLTQTVQVYLQNSLAEQSPEYSQGAGYPTTGYFVVPKDYIDSDGGLFVKLERFKPNTFYVAVNARSLNFDRPRYANSFNQSMGVLIANWYWLRDPAHQAYGQWTFRGLDPAAPATLVLDLLVTNKINGGSGYSTPIEVTLINPANNSQKTLRHVVGQNLLFTQSRSDSKGSGFQAYGSIALDNGFIDSLGNLTVRVARLTDASTHLAVNQNSVAIIQPKVTQELPTPPPTATKDSGLDGSNGFPDGKYLFIQYWNSVTGTGTLPNLAIDFPDYRFDPKTGTLSPFNPNRPIKLASNAWGLIGYGTSFSGEAGTGAVSSLDSIDQLPYSMDVFKFTGSIDLQAGPNMEETEPVGLRVLSVAEDGTISIILDEKTLALTPGQSWTQTVEADVHEGKYKGHLVMTSTLTNYGWQDRSKINLP